MKNNLLLLLTILLSMMMLYGCTKDNSPEDVLRLGSGGTGGNYYKYGENLNKLTREKNNYAIETIITSGSTANLRLISNGFLDLALAQSDTIQDALNGQGIFPTPLKGFHHLTALYTESCQVIVPANSNITSVNDLAGKRVSIGEEDSGVRQNALAILSAGGLSANSLKIRKLSFADSAHAMLNGELDAFFVTAGVPTNSISELAEQMPVKIISLTEEMINRICTDNPAYTASIIPPGSYKGQTEEIKTVGVMAVLLASDNLSPFIESDLLKILSENGQNLQKISFGKPVMQEEEKKASEDIFTININMYLTLALAVCVLYLGNFMRRQIKVLETFCIPAPVIGGLVFAVFSCIFYSADVAEFKFDETLKNVCMIMFFTSVGFQANFKVLKSGGLALLVFLGCVIVLIIAQNTLAVGLAHVLGISPFIGLCTGSIPMVGGHGTAGAFGMVLEDLGLESAITLCTASATFGLVFGSLMGGPLGRRLILKYDLLKTATDADDSVLVEDEVKHIRQISMYAPAAYQLAIAMGLGTLVSMLLSKTGMVFPIYIGAMIVAAAMRNIGEFSGKYTVHMGEINDLGGISLSLFLGIAMVTLKLWQLANLALPLVVLLLSQTVLMACFAYFVVFKVMGKDYDAAILTAGACGFGMGATPNAMANMQVLTDKFVPSVKAYILVPIVGSMFADFFNSLIITFFINFV